MRRHIKSLSDDVEEENNDLFKSSKRSAAFGHVVNPHFDLDEERAACMQRNQKILEELGLAPLIQSIKSRVATAAEAKKAAASKKRRIDDNGGEAMGQKRVLRQSLRTKGQEPELPPLLAPLFNRSQAERPYGEPGTKLTAVKSRAPVVEQNGGDASKFDAHNLHRLRTMSDEAMLKRIHKISNTLKLRSLVQLLRHFGRDELAQEAQAALDARLANV
ncbi:hypothetical protein VaNZ11_002633 [Volvox africanus]|uniref:Uncharacterized protein n=1 Tax=Volvox africanus TaxID=51714 RepID=A0ABQ5RT28_9CHLO|nr:hypothetical protein VaNZ11_002633 [Volvox africanus]